MLGFERNPPGVTPEPGGSLARHRAGWNRRHTIKSPARWPSSKASSGPCKEPLHNYSGRTAREGLGRLQQLPQPDRGV